MKNPTQHVPGPWMIGKHGRLQTVPNRAGGCTVIIDESLRCNRSAPLIVAAPLLLEVAEDFLAAWKKEIDGDEEINGADAVDWIIGFYFQVRVAVAQAKNAAP
jgi:hypothetical protein